jgi:hypothetical protein
MDDGKNLSTENNNSLKAQLGDNMADKSTKQGCPVMTTFASPEFGNKEK